MIREQNEKEVPPASLFLQKNVGDDQKVLSAKMHSKKMMHTDSTMEF